VVKIAVMCFGIGASLTRENESLTAGELIAAAFVSLSLQFFLEEVKSFLLAEPRRAFVDLRLGDDDVT
jgi:hypothetical protein